MSCLDDGKRKTKRGWSPGDSLNLVRVLSVRVNYSQQCRNDINGRWEYSKSIMYNFLNDLMLTNLFQILINKIKLSCTYIKFLSHISFFQFHEIIIDIVAYSHGEPFWVFFRKKGVKMRFDCMRNTNKNSKWIHPSHAQVIHHTWGNLSTPLFHLLQIRSDPCLMQHCSISSVSASEILQACTQWLRNLWMSYEKQKYTNSIWKVGLTIIWSRHFKLHVSPPSHITRYLLMTWAARSCDPLLL